MLTLCLEAMRRCLFLITLHFYCVLLCVVNVYYKIQCSVQCEAAQPFTCECNSFLFFLFSVVYLCNFLMVANNRIVENKKVLIHFRLLATCLLKCFPEAADQYSFPSRVN